MVGMYSSVFWLAQFATSSLLVLVNAIATVVLGYAFGLTLFRNADLGVHLVRRWHRGASLIQIETVRHTQALLFFFIMYGLAFLSMALFVSSVTSKVRTAIGFGFFIVILSMMS